MAEYRNTVRTVAVVPFAFQTGSADTLMSRRIADVARANAYEALRAAHADGRFTTVLQPIARTDSLLRNAGVSASVLGRRRNAELGRILGVDAILRGTITAFFDPAAGERVAAAVFFAEGFGGMRGEVHCVYELVDARSDELIWFLTEETGSGLLGGGSGALNKVGRTMAAKYPFAR